MTQGNAIECYNLTKTYERKGHKEKERVFAVKQINLCVPKNSIYGYLGPNGAGKSTTIKMLMAGLQPTEGEIWINGFDLLSEKKRALASVGYIPENATAYFPDISAKKFVRFMGQLRGLTRTEAEISAQEQLLFVGLEEQQDKVISKLSEGQKQRVGLAQALIGDPEILILDEPTANLDPMGKAEVATLFEKLREEGKTLFISSHLLAELQTITDRISVINKGVIIISGTVEELLAKFQPTSFFISVSEQEPLIKRLQRTAIVEEIIVQANGLVIKTNDPETIGRVLPVMLAEEKIILKEFKPLLSPLERIFFGAVEKSILEESFNEHATTTN